FFFQAEGGIRDPLVTGVQRVLFRSPFVLRSFDPSISEAHGRAVTGLRRVGKRIVIALEGDLYLVIHLMIAGRLHWKAGGAKVPAERKSVGEGKRRGNEGWLRSTD